MKRAVDVDALHARERLASLPLLPREKTLHATAYNSI